MEPASPIHDKINEPVTRNEPAHGLQNLSSIVSLQGDSIIKSMSADVPIGIAIFKGSDYVYEFVNNAYLQLVDRKGEDLLGKPMFEVIPELKGQELEKLVRQVMVTGKSYQGNEYEIKLVREGRECIGYFNFVCAPLKDENGITTGLMVVANEVTGIVERRHSLVEKEREFRNLVMQSPIPMTIWKGPEHVIEMANREMFKKIWRKEEKDIIGKKALEVFPELLDQKYPELLRKVYTTGATHRENESIAYVQGDDGMKKFYLDFEYAPLYESNGTISGIIITVNNATERVEARQKLEDAEARLRLATEGVGLATWDLDLPANKLVYSPRLAEIFGHDGRGKYTLTDLRSQFHTSDLHDIVEPAFEQALKTSVYFYEARVNWPDKSVRWIRTQGKVIYDEEKKPVRLLGTIQDITIEKQQSENTARLAAIVQSSEDAIVSKTTKGIITSWNPGAEKLFGYTSDEMIGESITKIIPADRINEEPQIIKRLLKGEIVDHFDTVRKTRSGKLVDISLTISPIRDRYGNITGASKIARNITAQKSLNNALLESEQRLQIAVQSAELGTWELDLMTKEPIYSERYLAILGFEKNAKPSHEELLQRIHPDDRAIREKTIATALRTGILDMEVRLIHPDNSIHWIRGRGKVFYNENNSPVRMLGTIMDITDQKRAFSALQESELLFKTIANVAPVGLWLTDKENKNNFVNDTWIEWTGLPAEEQYGQGWLSPVLKEDSERVTREFNKAAAAKEYFTSQFRIRRKDGQLRWYLTEGFPYFNNNGEFEGYAGSVTDITDRKTVEAELEKKVEKRTEELNVANAALEKSNSELEQFAYIASHDLQEPLRKIKTFVGRLQELNSEKSDPQAAVYMEKIVNASGRMSDLIRDLLEYSRTAKVTESPVTIDLNEVLDNVLNDFELMIGQKEAVIKADRLPVLKAVPHQMNQLFNNLVSNSLKFLKENETPVITITCASLNNAEKKKNNLDEEREYARITFSDNGIGFSNEFSERIFEIFQRLNPRHAYAGSGIGLSICRKIVANHHGIITADSTEGSGASFHIILPVN